MLVQAPLPPHIRSAVVYATVQPEKDVDGFHPVNVGKLMLGDPTTWDALMRALVAIVRPHLRAQVVAGAQALQVFDSWVGALSPAQYRRSVLPHSRAIFEGLADLDVATIVAEDPWHVGVADDEEVGRV